MRTLARARAEQFTWERFRAGIAQVVGSHLAGRALAQDRVAAHV